MTKETQQASNEETLFNLSRRNAMKAAAVTGVSLSGLTALSGSAVAQNGLEVTDITDTDLTPEDLAEALIGEDEDIEIVSESVEFTGADRAGGAFSGGGDIIDIEDGIILSSGQVVDIVGPNESANTTTSFGTPGDDDLDELSGFDTLDAAILEFEFEVPEGAEKVFFDYVFGSEEYNEYVGSQFNDVFALWVNDVNAAQVPDPDNPDESIPTAINNVNHGSDEGTHQQDPVNPELYINNDPFNGDTVIYNPLDVDEAPHNTEMDGFTVPLLAEAEVDPGETNTMRLAIADASDRILDSWVLIEGGSLTITPPVEKRCVDLIAGQDVDVGKVCVINDSDNLSVTYELVDDWFLGETHLHVAGDEDEDDDGDCDRIPQAGNGNPKVGHFGLSSDYDPGVQEDTYVINRSDNVFDEEFDDEEELCIAAHAEVYHGDREETAWGEGDRFTERGNWAMHFNYTVQEI